MLIFWLCSTSDDQPGWSVDSKPICQPSPANKMKCFFLDCVHFWWSARLVDGLEPHLPPLSSQKNEMLIFGFCSTSDDQPGWSMDSNPICHPSPAKKSEMLIFLLQSTSDLGQTGQWTQTPSTTNLQPIKWNACFWIMLSVWWLAGLVDWLKPHLPPLFSQKMKSSFLDYVQLLMISWAGQWTRTPSANPLQPKKWNAYFCITINFWFRPDWSMDSNPIHHPSPTNKMKCLFLDYAQRLMIGWAGWRTQTPSTTPLQSKNEILIFGLCSTSDDQPGWSMDSKLICHPSPANKMKCSFLDYVHFGWSARLVNGLKPHPPPLSTQ